MLAPRPSHVCTSVYWLAVLAVSVALLACHPATGMLRTATATTNAGGQPAATIAASPASLSTRQLVGTRDSAGPRLRVRLFEQPGGGASLPPLTSGQVQPTRVPSAFRGQATIWISPVGHPTDIVAQGTLSDSNWAIFSIPAGHYWVFLPRDHQTTLANPSVAQAQLPDNKTAVDGWAEVTVPPRGSVDATLFYVYMYP